jgi:dienelactone hydrolase
MQFIAAVCLGIAFLWSGGLAGAAIVEEIIQLPVRVTDMRGTAVNHTITVTIFRESGWARSPFLILNHGRSSSEAERAKLGRARFTNNARYFVSKGFAVFVPTRIGYGVTGGPDVEYSGNCHSRNYPPVYEAAAQQSLTVLQHAKTLPYVDPQKGLVVGQSFGGATAIALAAKKIPGVLAAVNFAGGGGGNPKTRPERPCRDDLMADLFASYGASARIPTLWLYSENDQYWGKDKPKAWFERFIKRGGSGQFVQLPPAEDDGHRSFTSNPTGWRPAFEEFLRTCCGSSFAE